MRSPIRTASSSSAVHTRAVSPYTLSFTSLQTSSGRSGVYDVFVMKDGFQDWSQLGVRVEDGTCGAVTVELTARLVPVDANA